MDNPVAGKRTGKCKLDKDMPISENGIKEISNVLKIKPEVLQSAISSDENVEYESLGSPIKYSYTEDERIELMKSVEKETSKKSKLAGEEMLFKRFKKEKYPDSNAKDFFSLFEEIENHNKNVTAELLEQKEKDLTGDVDARITSERSKREELLEKNKTLQETIKSLKETHENEKNNWKKNLRNQKVDTDIVNEFSILEFDIPKDIEFKGDESVQKYISNQRENAVLLFNTKYLREFDEDGNVVFINKKTNEKLVDEATLTPKTVKDIVLPFAKENMPNLRKDETFGKGGHDTRTLNAFSGISKNMKLDDFKEYAKSNNLAPGTEKHDEAWKKFRELNPSN